MSLALLVFGNGPVWPEEPPESLRELESLGETPVGPRERMDSTVTSVGKKAQRLSESATAVYVITPEDIRRSGVTSIPEALRLAPGMDVARIDSNKWAISARGFNGRFANKLLVLMDGREVYNPSFGGVYWEVQDLPLEDIDRIEVIRGPGAALWGANAVNGVVNIITKNARDTQGGSLGGGGGSYEQGFGSLRYGMALDEHTHGRVYAKGVNRGGFASPTGSADDSWSMTQTGFRLDRDDGTGSRLMASGAAYHEDFNQQVLLPGLGPPTLNFLNRDRGTASGFNLLGRWNQSLSLSSEFSLQAFYDHTYRTEAFLTQERDTLDLEFQHRFLWWERHDISWGLGYRLLMDRFGNTVYASMNPSEANHQLFSLFLQDDIGLIENELTLSLGAKLQRNDYTGFEGQPSARLLWMPNPRHSVWGAISRAVRIPTRGDCCLDLLSNTLAPLTDTNPSVFPVVAGVEGNPKFQAERVWAYELGYRFKPLSNLSLDLALFYNEYSNLRAYDLNRYNLVLGEGYPRLFFPALNGLSATSYGVELLADWRPWDWWKLTASYSFQKIDAQGSPQTTSESLGTTPEQQAYLRSGFNLTPSLDLDFWLRYVDRLPLGGSTNPVVANGVPAYLTLDTRLAWRPVAPLELSVVGQNLLNSPHTEFIQEGFGAQKAEVPRGFYLQFNWKF